MQACPVGVYLVQLCFEQGGCSARGGFCLANNRERAVQAPDLPVFYDYEYDSERCKERGVTPTKRLRTGYNKGFCERIKASGYEVGISPTSTT